MAMLAEPRRKKRSMNLRGKNHWSEDQNKFGKKLMEKMGWEDGKGLGVNLNGNVDHVKVRFKDDNGGVGFSDKNDQWTCHETDFNGLLQALHGGSVDTSKLHSETSLEEKSKKLQSRLHYKKFTRGKDITQYSQKDLANIFGKKTLDEKKKTEVEEVPEVEKEESSKSSEDGMNNLVTAGSMADYFKRKYVHRNISSENVGNQSDIEENKNYDEEEDCDVVFRGFSGTSDVKSVAKESFSFYNTQSGANKKKSVDFENESTEFSQQDGYKVTKDKKKKKNNTFEIMHLKNQESDFKIENDCVDIAPDMKQVEEMNVDEIIVSKKKKKNKKSKSVPNEAIKDFDEINNTEVLQNGVAKKSKKRKIEDVLVNDHFLENGVEETRVKKLKKKNKKKESLSQENGIYNQEAENELIENSGNLEKSKTEKKDKVLKEVREGVEEPKKKKKKNNKVVELEVIEIESNSNVKKNKKKKKHESL